MKRKELQKKLILGKQTITTLNQKDLTTIHGGDFTEYETNCTGDTCWLTICKITKCIDC